MTFNLFPIQKAISPWCFFRRVSAKTIISHWKCQSCELWMGPNGEPIRSIFTLEWKLHPTFQIISHSGIPIEDFISRFLSSLDPPFIFLHPKHEVGSHRGICSRKKKIAMPRLVFCMWLIKDNMNGLCLWIVTFCWHTVRQSRLRRRGNRIKEDNTLLVIILIKITC